MHTALDDQVPTPGAAAGGLPAGGATATDASIGADAEFLDQLFCCPITKVLANKTYCLPSTIRMYDIYLLNQGLHLDAPV